MCKVDAVRYACGQIEFGKIISRCRRDNCTGPNYDNPRTNLNICGECTICRRRQTRAIPPSYGGSNTVTSSSQQVLPSISNLLPLPSIKDIENASGTKYDNFELPPILTSSVGSSGYPNPNSSQYNPYEDPKGSSRRLVESSHGRNNLPPVQSSNAISTRRLSSQQVASYEETSRLYSSYAHPAKDTNRFTLSSPYGTSSQQPGQSYTDNNFPPVQSSSAILDPSPSIAAAHKAKYPCLNPGCNSFFKEENKLHIHNKTCKYKDAPGDWECGHCHKRFYKGSNVKPHIQANHLGLPIDIRLKGAVHNGRIPK